MIAARFLTPPEEGFSGAVLVAIYGSGGALVGIITGIVLARKVPDHYLMRVTLGVIALSGLTIGLIFVGLAK
jgi:small basic protein